MKNHEWKKSVVYQIYPKSFKDTTGNGVGDIRGITSKLDYINNLGADFIWLCPIYKSPMRDNGYDISDYMAINELYGDMDDFVELLEEAHKRGIKIMMDLVLNHTSSEHKWFKEAKSSKENKYRDYYIWRDKPNDIQSIFGGSAWAFDESTNQYYFHLFDKTQPDLNWENPVVIKEIYQMINFWIEKGVDGFRFDVIDLLGKEIDKKIVENGPTLHKIIHSLNENTFGGKHIMTVGETWGATIEEAIKYSDPKRKELNMVFQFEHITLDWGKYGKWTPKKITAQELRDVLKKWQLGLKDKGWNSLFLCNHDLPRIVSRWGDDEKYHAESAKMLAILIHMQQGTPFIYQGEEIGMTNVRYNELSKYEDVEIHSSYKDLVLDSGKMTKDEFMDGVYKMGRDNARTPMQWDDGLNAGFSISKNTWLPVNPNYKYINVANSLQNKESIFYTYKELIYLRKHSCYSQTIINGEYEPILLEYKDIIGYRRKDSNYNIDIIANFSKNTIKVDYLVEDKKLLLNNYKGIDLDEKSILLMPFQALVLAY